MAGELDRLKAVVAKCDDTGAKAHESLAALGAGLAAEKDAGDRLALAARVKDVWASLDALRDTLAAAATALETKEKELAKALPEAKPKAKSADRPR